MGRNVEVVSNMDIVVERLHKNAEKALKKIGMVVESAAKGMAPVDTGLLRNSITYALGGGAPAAGSYAADNGSNRQQYSGKMDEDGAGEMTVVIGTGVEYAAYQELGHHTRSGSFVPAQPFLRPAMENSFDQIRAILETDLRP